MFKLMQIYGPQSSSGQSKLDFFPGIVDALYRSSPWLKEEDRKREIQHEIWRVARAIQRAARVLKGGLT